MQPTLHAEIESIWPTAAQKLLLRAALAEGRAALDSLAAWKQATGFARYSDIDFLSTYLLPLVWSNLSRSNLSDDWLAQMAGLHRYELARNAARMRSLVEVLRHFDSSAMPFVLLGDFALLAAGYLDGLGDRPMLDAEFVIGPGDAAHAREVLSSVGWHSDEVARSPVVGWRSEYWRLSDQQTLPIHYRWLPKPYPVVGLRHLLDHARTIDSGGATVRIPDAADLVVQACIGGRRFQGDRARQLLWIADLILILRRSAADLDWDRLLRDSRLHGTLHPLREALAYAAEEFDAPVPGDWLAAAWNVQLSPAEMRPYYRSIRRKSGRTTRGLTRRRPWDGYVAAEQAAGRTPSASGMLRYLIWRTAKRLKQAG